jgi:hypothetical protein
MAKNIFLDNLNNRELMDSFGVQQDNTPLTPEELATLSIPIPTPVQTQDIITPQIAPQKLINRSEQKSQNTENPFMQGVPNIDDVMARLPKDDTTQPPTQGKELTPLERYEALIEQYRSSDEKKLEEARSRDRMLKVGGAIGDALATYINAQGQKNVMAPGVQVQQGAGLGKVADMFATAPEIQSDVATRREALMKQYAELARGERAETRAQTQKEIAEEKNKIAEERNKLFGQQVAKMGAGREESRQFREEKFEYDKIKNLQDSFNKDKQVVKAEERMASARTMRDFLTENNPIGAEAAKRFAARASGEVGTLTDQDVSVFGGSRAVLDRLQQAAQELATGTLTESNKKFMNQLANTFEKAGQRDLQDRLDIYAKQGTKRTKMSEGEVKETIRPDLVLQQQEQVKPSVAPKDQQALDWANKNPTDPRSIQIKKRLGM